LDATDTTITDRLAKICAPIAARWDAEAERRNKARTPETAKAYKVARRAERKQRIKVNGIRTSLAKWNAVPADKRGESWEQQKSNLQTKLTAEQFDLKCAREDRRDARRAYPRTMTEAAARIHGIHVVPAALFSYSDIASGHVLGAWPAACSVGLVGLHAATVRLGRKAKAAVQGDYPNGLSVDERRLWDRLQTAYWTESLGQDAQGRPRPSRAAQAGLAGLVPGTADVFDRGIEITFRLDGPTYDDFVGLTPKIRRFLGTRSDLKIRHAKAGDDAHARLRFMTRLPAMPKSMKWVPEMAGTIGIDMESGERVPIPEGRLLIAASSGAGKSVLLATILATHILDPNAAVIYIDGKGEEATLWINGARIAVTRDEMVQVCRELLAENDRRAELLKTKKLRKLDSILSPDLPRIVVVVDEGTIVNGLNDDKKAPITEPLAHIALTGRSRCIDLIWCTQKPTVGEGAKFGIPSQIIGVMDQRLVLKTAGASESQQVLGSGWDAHKLPTRGLALRYGMGFGPDQEPVKVWDLSDEEPIKKLPARTPWRHNAPTGEAAPTLTLVKGESAEVPAPREAAPALTDSETTLLGVLLAADGPQRHRDLVEAAGMAKATVSKALTGLTGHGLVVRDGQTYAATDAAREVSA
jgi:S-DNA-T family DNA segregation ATPase FtsK/SpoIIIE